VFQECRVIQLTRLNNSPLVVNSDLIKFVEQSPDTVITLVNGEKILVRESADQVMHSIVEFRRSILQGSPGAGTVAATNPTAAREAPAANQQAER
jgi:flagellar protein FlbD